MDFQLSELQQDLITTARALAQDRRVAAAERAQVGLPMDYLRLLADRGFAGIAIPENDGGQGGSLLDAVLVIEAMARESPVAGDAIQAMNFGAIQQLAHHGSAHIKDRFLAPALRGERLATIAMTEPEAGSAVTELQSRAQVDGDLVTLQGRKVFTGHPDTADIFVVWVRFGESHRSAGALVVERGTPGFDIDASHQFMSGDHYGMLYFDNAKVPVENILVPEDGFRKMLSVFNVERLGNSARSIALGQAALDRAVTYVKERRQFGRRLVEFQGLQWRIAEMMLKLESARLLLYRAAANSQAGLPSALETSLAKLACNRAGFEVANDALQLFGAYGYDQDSDVNYFFRRTRGWMIAGGSIEQMLNRIAAEVCGEHFSQRPGGS